MVLLRINLHVTFEGFKNLFKLNNTKGNRRLQLKQKKDVRLKRLEAEEVKIY